MPEPELGRKLGAQPETVRRRRWPRTNGNVISIEHKPALNAATLRLTEVYQT